LVSVLECRPRDCEVVVVFNRHYDDPYDLREEVRLVHAPAKAGWAECVNCGVRVSQSPVLHVLSCGVEVAPGWTDDVLSRFDEPDVAAVSPLVLNQQDFDRVVTSGVAWHPSGMLCHVGHGMRKTAAPRLQGEVCGPSALAGFYRTAALESIGLFDADVGDWLAAVDVALKLQRAGTRCVVEPRSVAYAETFGVAGPRPLRYGIEAERFFRREARQGRRLSSWAWHAGLLKAEFLRSPLRPSLLVRLAGRALAYLRAPATRKARRPSPNSREATAGHAGPPHFASAGEPQGRVTSSRSTTF
jgi:hypothetical protein